MDAWRVIEDGPSFVLVVPCPPGLSVDGAAPATVALVGWLDVCQSFTARGYVGSIDSEPVWAVGSEGYGECPTIDDLCLFVGMVVGWQLDPSVVARLRSLAVAHGSPVPGAA